MFRKACGYEVFPDLTSNDGVHHKGTIGVNIKCGCEHCSDPVIYLRFHLPASGARDLAEHLLKAAGPGDWSEPWSEPLPEGKVH